VNASNPLLRPSTAIDGHPYCATCIDAGVPQQTRYTLAQEDKKARGDGADWGMSASVSVDLC